MIPIRDTIPASRKAWMVRALIAANLGAFAWELGLGPQLEATVYRLGVVPAFWADGSAWRWLQLAPTLITSQFLHGGALHLGSNLLYLWIFGDNVEDRLGPLRFLALYVVSGAVAALTQVVMQPWGTLPMIGASGAIAGVLGTYLVFFPASKIITLVPWVLMWDLVEIPAFLFLGFWFFLQWLQGMTTIGQVASMGGVAWWAHVGGFLTGMALGPRLPRRPQRF